MFNETIILENEFVLLRPLLEDDLQHLQHFIIEEPEIWKFSLVQMTAVENLKNYIEQAIENRKKKKEYAGCTRFYDIQLAYQYLQLGYTWYGKGFQGTYVNKNCKLLLLEFAFEKLGMERVEFRADNRNEKSKLAMQSIGCVVEGVLRNHLPKIEGGRRASSPAKPIIAIKFFIISKKRIW